MFRARLLDLVRTSPEETGGPVPEGGVVEYLREGSVVSGSGGRYRIRDGYLDLLGPGRAVGDNIANLTNYLPGAGAGYEPLWRGRSLSLLTGEEFSNAREMDLVFDLADLKSGGVFLDLGCSAGLYTRNAARRLGSDGDVVGIDLAPSMLKEAVKKAHNAGVSPSFVRADAKRLPFADGSFAGALCGGTLNELGDPARVLRETARVVRPGGRLAIMGILRAETRNGRRLQRLLSTGGVSFFEPQKVASMLDHAGFKADPLVRFGPVFFVGASVRDG
ncbi:class I SAM-dependent methyltransferase [Rubrobacter indicoceani]|uniref:class I SAM-dependent methyltransferase n=1 Tax=Rubrobacter indicoceani TaxID=2051957 RepID=UPI000E5B219B|nr:methyltransferase domain-containing protein [Rubrobacter indicoceani]